MTEMKSSDIAVSDLLQLVVDEGASDLHLTVGVPPVFRLHGRLHPLDAEPTDLREQTAVVLGLGAIGSEIARLAQALHLHVIGVRRSLRRPDDPVDELVAPALEEGHLYALMVGWVLGGLLFIALNEVVNNFGGFMRKASTTVYHLRKREHQHFKRVLSGLDRMEVFRELPLKEVKALVDELASQGRDDLL